MVRREVLSTTKRAVRLRSSRCDRLRRLLSAASRLKTHNPRTSRADIPNCTIRKDILSWAILQRTLNWTCRSTHTFACSPGFFLFWMYSRQNLHNSPQAFQPITENVGLIRLDVLGHANLRPQALFPKLGQTGERQQAPPVHGVIGVQWSLIRSAFCTHSSDFHTKHVAHRTNNKDRTGKTCKED